MQFRLARASDFDAVFRGYREVVREEKRKFFVNYHRKLLRNSIREKRNIVCVENGKIIGFAEWNPVTPDLPLLFDEGYCWIDWLWVDRKCRRKGVGRKLYEQIFKLAKKKGFKHIALDVFTVNKAGRNFHESAGFMERLKIYTRKL